MPLPDEQPQHGLHQKESPVSGPAASAGSHQPTPVAGIAKPKAKAKKVPKAVAEEEEASREMVKKTTLPPAGPAASATGHQPTPVAGIAKPKAKGRKAMDASR